MLNQVDLLVPMELPEQPPDTTLLDIYKDQPPTNDLSVLDSFPLIKQLFLKLNTLLPSSAAAGMHLNFIEIDPLGILKNGWSDIDSLSEIIRVRSTPFPKGTKFLKLIQGHMISFQKGTQVQ